MSAQLEENAYVGSPFHARTGPLNVGASWYAWNGHVVPNVYTDPHRELRAIRESASLVDMSPICKYEISGPDAPRLIDRLITRDATQLAVDQILYTPLCNEQGRLVADGLVFRLSENHYRLSLDRCDRWFARQARGFDTQIENVTRRFAMLALQGPRSRDVLEAASGESWSGFPFSRRRTTRIGGAEVDVARQGFTGELGYELWVAATDAVQMWDAVWKAGRPYGLYPAGEVAVDTARVEAGLILISFDYVGAGPDRRSSEHGLRGDLQVTPFDVGLGHFVDLHKGDFIGKQALIGEKASGIGTDLVGLEFDRTDIDRACSSARGAPSVSGIWGSALPIITDGRPVGCATSIIWSPSVDKVIAFGRVETALAVVGTRLLVEWSEEPDGKPGEVRAEVVTLPFVKRRRARKSSE